LGEAPAHLARVKARGLGAKPGQQPVERLVRDRGSFDLGPGVAGAAMSGEMHGAGGIPGNGLLATSFFFALPRHARRAVRIPMC